MNPAPRISVLMPVHNGEPYLREAIDSVLNQTFPDFELLIIDDGSTDASREICRSYADPRLRLEENGRNLGLITTLNKGLDLAKGEYIARMDCDDISLPRRFERQAGFMDAHPDIGICGSWYEKLDEGRAIVLRLPTDHATLRFFMLFDNPFQHSSIFMRRSVLEAWELRFDPAFIHAEDYEFWARCSEHTGVANLPEVLLRYRSHPDNVSHRFKTGQHRTADQVRRRQLAQFGPGATESEIQLHLALANFEFSSASGEPEAVKAWLDKLITLGCRQCHIPESAVYRHLARYWYGVCGNFAEAGLRTWRLFDSSPLGRAAGWQWQWKLLLRCLLRKNIVASPQEAQP